MSPNTPLRRHVLRCSERASWGLCDPAFHLAVRPMPLGSHNYGQLQLIHSSVKASRKPAQNTTRSDCLGRATQSLAGLGPGSRVLTAQSFHLVPDLQGGFLRKFAIRFRRRHFLGDLGDRQGPARNGV
jgi:hypothetical protein